MRNLMLLMLTAVCFISSIGYASEKDAGIITGMVVDEETHKPILSATVALLNQADSKILASVVSGNDGNFEISHVPFGKYSIKASSNKNESKIVDAVEVSEQTGNVKLGQIILAKANSFQMEEINIVSERLKGEEKIDRTVYTINDDIRKVSTTGLDMLRNIPSVTVDFLNNVMLEGRSDIQFYVDGIKRDKEFVMQLDPQIIDKVELITNPSVKYDQDISGVISIILKKQGRFGVSGSVTLPVTNPDKGVADPAARIEYGSDRYRVYGGVSPHYEGFNRKQSQITQWSDQSAGSRRFVKTSADKVKWINEYANYGVDWFINDKTSLNFLGEFTSWEEKSRDNIIDNRSYQNNVLNQYYKTLKNNDGGSDNYYFSIFLKRDLEQEGCEFTAEAYFNKQSGGMDNKYIDVYYNIADMATITDTVTRREKIDDSFKTSQLKLDYAFLIKNIKNEIGARTFFGRKDSRFDNSIESSDSIITQLEQFKYDQWRQAAYYNASGELDNFKWQLGWSGEYSGIDINDTSHVHNFFLTPQTSLQRDFNDAGNVKLSYQRRIRRPEVYQLDPFERTEDSMHVRKGNPDLKPEIENSLELTYSKNFKSNFISPRLYLLYTNNAIQNVVTIRNNGISVTTDDNIGKSVEYGLGVNASFQVAGSWRLNGNAAVYNKEISSRWASDNDVRQQKSGYRFDVTNIFTFPKEYSLSLIAQYYGPTISYQREDRRDLLVLLDAGKKFSNKADLNIMYVPFIKDFTYSKSIVSYPGYREENAGSVYAKNLFVITFTYHFNYGKQIKKIERNVEYEKSGGGGGL
jgi:hypothetical protein